MNEDSFEDIEKQILEIEQAHSRSQAGATGISNNNQNVSLESESGEEGKQGSRAQSGNDDDIFNAIVASLINYTGTEGDPEAARKAA